MVRAMAGCVVLVVVVEDVFDGPKRVMLAESWRPRLSTRAYARVVEGAARACEGSK